MPKFPEPPVAATLAGVVPDLLTIRPGERFWRVYFRGGSHPTFWNSFRAFGPTRGRFDHHLPPPRIQERGILYAATHGQTSLAEVFQESRTIDRNLGEPWLVAFEMRAAVVLLDLSGAWPTRAGASMAISNGPKPRSQRWARAIYEAYPEVQGLLYASSMYKNQRSIALFERGESALSIPPLFHRPLADPGLLPTIKQVAHEIGYRLI